MRIALINGNSQGAKNGMIHYALRRVADHYGYEVSSYDMYTAGDRAWLTYVRVEVLAAALPNSKATDYMVTGYETGKGAILICNSFPGVICGHVEDALGACTLAQINDGSAIALPLAKGFGWDNDLNLEYTFEKLFYEPSGQGYPKERAVSEQRDKKILDEVRKVTPEEDLMEIFRGLDRESVKGAFTGEKFSELFLETCRDEELASYIRGLLVQP